MNTKKKDSLLGYVYSNDYTALLNTDGNTIAKWRDADGRTLLMHSVLDNECRLATIKALLQKGVDPYVADKKQSWSALHFVARKGIAFGPLRKWRPPLSDQVHAELKPYSWPSWQNVQEQVAKRRENGEYIESIRLYMYNAKRQYIETDVFF